MSPRPMGGMAIGSMKASWPRGPGLPGRASRDPARSAARDPAARVAGSGNAAGRHCAAAWMISLPILDVKVQNCRRGGGHDQPDSRIRSARRGVPRGRSDAADHDVRTGPADPGSARLSRQGHAVAGTGGTRDLTPGKGRRLQPGPPPRPDHRSWRDRRGGPDPPAARLSAGLAGTRRRPVPPASASRSGRGLRRARPRAGQDRLAAGRRGFRGTALSAPDPERSLRRGPRFAREDVNPSLAPPGGGRPTSPDHPDACWGSERTAEEP